MKRFGARDLGALGLLLAVFLLMFAPALAQPDKLLFGKDLYGEWFNYESFIRHALSHGQLPLWNPYNSSGTPVLSDPQMGLLYPPNVLLRWLPLNAFFVVAYILHFWLAAAGVYLLCRQLALWRGACLAGALGVALSTPLTQLIYPGHLTVIYSLAWLPLIMALVIRSVQRGRWLPLPGLVFALVLQFMAGFPQISVYTLGCVALYYGYSFVWPPHRGSRRNDPRQPLQFTLLMLLFFGVGALQIFPTLRLVAETGRSAGLSWDYATKGSLPASQLATILFPMAFDDARDGYVPYVGWLLLTMAPLAFASRQRLRIAVFFTMLGTTALALASARDFPLFALVHSILPIFRIPNRALFIWCLCIGVLGAIGLDVIRGHGTTCAWPKKRTAAYLLILALVLVLLAASGITTDAVDSGTLAGGSAAFGTAVWILALEAVGFAVLGAGILSRRARALMVVTAIAMVWIDLYPLSRPLVTVNRPERYETVSEALDDLDVGRVIDLCTNIIPANRFMEMRVAATDGYNSLFLADYARFLGLVNGDNPSEPLESWGSLNGRGQMPPRLDLLRMMNVTHVLSCAPAMDRGLVLVREFERRTPGGWLDAYVYRLRGALPRAVMTCGDRYWAGKEQAVEFLAEGSWDQAADVLNQVDLANAGERENMGGLIPQSELAESDTGFSVIVNPQPCGTEKFEAVVRVLSRDNPSGELVLDVVAPQAGFLYISEAYYPERQVWVDGVQGELRRANLAFSGVELAAGRHRVTIRYVPESWYLGIAVSCFTMVAWAGFAAAARRRMKLRSLRDSTSCQADLVEPSGSPVGKHGESGGYPSMRRLPSMHRTRIAKGALIAMSCGVLAFAGRVAFLSATAPVNRTVNVRWIPGTTAEQRGQSEQRLDLGQGRLVDGTTWTYQLREPTAENLEAITRDAVVEDTHGFDPETFEFPPSRVARRALPLGIWTAVAAGIALLLRWAGNRRG